MSKICQVLFIIGDTLRLPDLLCHVPVGGYAERPIDLNWGAGYAQLKYTIV
jgi:hypothetical protein